MRDDPAGDVDGATFSLSWRRPRVAISFSYSAAGALVPMGALLHVKRLVLKNKTIVSCRIRIAYGVLTKAREA